MRSRLPWVLAAVTFALHVLGEPHYGFFRDELYFIVSGRHPAWGYVDQPPVVPLLAALSQLFGPSLVAIRAVSALFAGGTVYVACLTVIDLGGRRFAQLLAGICVMLGTASVALSTDTPTGLLSPLIVLLVLRMVKGGDLRLWLFAGAAAGVWAETKYSVVYVLAALFGGLALGPERAILKSRWFLYGCAIAAVLALPNVTWQALHGFPMIELLRNDAAGKNVVLTPIEFIERQLVNNNVVLSLVWVCGLVFAAVRRELRWLFWTYVLLVSVLIALHGKDYYAEPIYSSLFALGSVAVEEWIARTIVMRRAIVAGAVVTGLITLPLYLPILPAESYIGYTRFLHLDVPSSEHRKVGSLPQEYADMHGWPGLARTVAAAYDGLPVEERSHTAILTSNYGEAAAIDFFGAPYGLPPALSGHNQYFLWGPRGYDGAVVMRINGNAAVLRKRCSSVRLLATYANPMGMPDEDGIPIYLCTGIRPNLQTLWPLLKHYD